MLNSMSLTIHLDNIQKIEPEVDCLNRFAKITYENCLDNSKHVSKHVSKEQSQQLLKEYSENINENCLDQSLGDFLYSF